MTTVKFSFTKSQLEFYNLKCTNALFVGGYGTGKSYLAGRLVFLDLLKGGDIVVGVYAPDYDKLNSVSLKELKNTLTDMGWEEGVDFFYNKATHILTTANPNCGSVYFRTLDDPERLVGYETFSAYLDELDTMDPDKAELAYRKVLGRNRQQPKNIDVLADDDKYFDKKSNTWKAYNRIKSFTTPEGYKFCYKRWVTHGNDRYQLVRGTTYDNPALSSEYIEELKAGLTEQQIRAYIYGEFVNMTSGTVYYAYDRAAHSSREKIMPMEPLYIGCDFNVGNMAATIYVKRKGGKEWHAVEELSGLLDTPNMVDIIQENWADRGHRIYMYPDSTGSNRKTTNASMSDISMLRQAGFSVRAKATNPRVKDRIAATNKAFESGVLYVNELKCPQVSACLEQQAYDKNNEPDKKSGFDHQNDATTYPIAYELPIRKRAFNLDIGFAF